MRIFGILPQLLSYFNTKGVSESIEIAATIGCLGWREGFWRSLSLVWKVGYLAATHLELCRDFRKLT
jgi:hypothetical protein